MVITEISATEVLRSSREALGLQALPADAIDDAMLAASLRRAAGILCPCSPFNARYGGSGKSPISLRRQ